MPTRTNFTKGEATKKDLMAAASRVFAKHGYINTEIRQISHEAGKSSGTFYIYFKNKSEILAALVEEFDADLVSGFVFAESPDGAVFPEPTAWKQRVRWIWETFRRHSATFFALAQAAAIAEEFHLMERRLRQRAIDDFHQLIRMQQAKGLCQDLDTTLAAIAMETMLNGFLYKCLAEPEYKISDEPQLDRAIETLIGLISGILQADQDDARDQRVPEADLCQAQ